MAIGYVYLQDNRFLLKNTWKNSFICFRYKDKEYRIGVGNIVKITGIHLIDIQEHLYEMDVILQNGKSDVEYLELDYFLYDEGQLNKHLLDDLTDVWLVTEHTLKKAANISYYDNFRCRYKLRDASRYIITAKNNKDYKTIFATNGKDKLLGTIFTTMSEIDLEKVRKIAEEKVNHE